MTTPVNHVANIRQIFVNLRQDSESLQAEIEITENSLLYWTESGVEADYMSANGSDEPETVENQQVGSISKSQSQAKLLPLEEVHGMLVDYTRSSLNDFIKAEIRSLEHTRFSQLTVG